MKKILIDCCRVCSLRKAIFEMGFEYKVHPFFKCTHPATESRRIDHPDIIPDWCMLKDD